MHRLLFVVSLLALGCSSSSSSPKLDAAHSTLTANRTDGIVADGVDKVSFTVHLVNTDGSPAANVAVSLTASGSANTFGVTTNTDASGNATQELASTKAETKTITATASGSTVGTPLNVTFTAGALSATNSSLAVSPSTTYADPYAPMTLTATVLDAFGNPVAGQPVAFEGVVTGFQGGSGPATFFPTASAVTDAQGIASVQAFSDGAGSAAYTATAGAAVLHASGTFNGVPWVIQGGDGIAEVTGLAMPSSNVLYASTYGAGVFAMLDQSGVWSPRSNGLGSANVEDVASHPNDPSTVYAATDSGLYVSTDSAMHWTLATLGGSPTSAVAVAPSSPATIYVGHLGLNGAGVSVSTDSGATWTERSSGLTNGAGPTAIVVDTVSPDQAYVSYDSLGVFKTINGGQSWSAINSGLTDLHVHALALDALTPALYAGTNQGVFKSTDFSTWTQVATGMPGGTAIWSLAVDPATAGTVYAGASSGVGLYVSSDSGANWALRATGLPTDYVFAIAVDPENGQNLFAGLSYDAVYQSTNGGSSWSGAYSELSAVGIPSIVAAPDGSTLYAFTDDNYRYLLQSTDTGTSWSRVGAFPSSLKGIGIDPNNAANLYLADGISVYVSTDTGGTWNEMRNGLTSTSLTDLVATSDAVYVSSNDSGVFKTTDGAANWTQVNTGLTGPEVLDLVADPSAADTLYALVAGPGWFKTVDGGANWTALPPPGNGFPMTSLTVDPTTPTTLYGAESPGGLNASTGPGALWKSTDGGQTWTKLYTQASASAIHQIALDPANAGTIYLAQDDGLWKSTDGGASFRFVSYGLPFKPVGAIYAGASPRLVLGSLKTGIYVSLTGGE